MRSISILWLCLSQLALAQPSLIRAEQVLKFPLTRSQSQSLSRLQGPAFDREVGRIGRRGHTKLVGELNQQAVDALAEWFLFAVALLDGQTPAEAPPGSSFADHIQQILRRAWPKLAPETQKKVLAFPEYWASVRRDWPTLSPEQKQQLLDNWRAALGPLLHSTQRQELARACLADLYSTYRKAADPVEFNQALQRVENAARRMAAEGDPESKAVARQLQQAMLSIQAQRDQSRALQEIENQQARLGAPAGGDYNRVFNQINQSNLKRYHLGP